MKKKKWKIEEWSSVDGKLRNAEDPGRLRRQRRFQTSKPWLLFLAFSTYFTRIASPGPVRCWPSSRFVNLRASSTRAGNAGPGFDLAPPMISFMKRGRKDAMNIFKPGLVTNTRREGDEHTLLFFTRSCRRVSMPH